MKIRVYKGTILAASIDAGQSLVYHGQTGQQVKSLIEAEAQASPGRSPERVLRTSLPDHGYQVVRAQVPDTGRESSERAGAKLAG